MTEREVIERHLRDMADMVSVLRQHSGATADELKSDKVVLLAVQHALQRAIQNLLDIGTHMLSRKGINDWDEYRQVIVKLGAADVIPTEFAENISAMAGLRNILIHAYTEIDLESVSAILAEQLDDFDEFARYISAHLDAGTQT